MFDISSDKVVLIPYKTGQYFWNACRRDDDVPAKGNRCPYCKSAQHSVHPTLRQAQGPLVGVCAFSGVCVAWSWFRQNGVISSHPPVPRRGIPTGCCANASRWALSLISPSHSSLI